MNDGKKKRSIFSYILPYLLIGSVVGMFVWLVVRNMFNNVQTWNQSDLDTYLKVEVSEKPVDGEIYEVSAAGSTWESYKQQGHVIYAYNVSEVQTTVNINGYYFDASNRSQAFTVRLESKVWNEDFNVNVEIPSAIPGQMETVTARHVSYRSLFEFRVNQAKAYETDQNRLNAYGYTVSNAFEVSWWDSWGPTIITTGITLLLVFFLFSRLNSAMSGGGQNGLMSFNKSPARRADHTKVRFADVAGCEEEKAEMEELVQYLKDPKKYTKLGARLPKGVLLIGPPGTGKTLLAKAVAGEAGAPFYSISGSDFVEMYVGVGAGRVRDLFKQAKATAPCLIFIDEIDAVGRQRGAGLGGGNDEREQTLNQLLVEMDGFEANSGILVIAATNRDDVLDPALRRAGRFDRTITVSLPDKAGREAIFKVHARNKNVDPNVDFGAIAKRTVGFSGADIDSVLNDAAILAVRRNAEKITLKDIDEAIDRRIAGPAKSSRGMSEQERKQVAYHEAGHAVIGLNLPFSDKVQKITIVPRGNTGGHVLMTPEDDRFLMTKNELIARITGLLGGRTSEEIFFQDVSTGASNDIEQATHLARLMVTEFGMSALGPIQYERDTGSVFLGRDYANTQKNFSTQIAFEIDKEVRAIIESAHENARKVLMEHKDQVILVAERLLAKETITAEEIEFLCTNGYLPEDKAEEKEAEIIEEKADEATPVAAEAKIEAAEEVVDVVPESEEQPIDIEEKTPSSEDEK